MLDLSYVLPIKWSPELDRLEVSAYLEHIAGLVTEVIVVDGSPPADFDAGAAAWGSVTRHLAPDPALKFLNGKVSGVTTGIRAARCEKVVIADDDVRHDEASLARIAELLDDADLVRPQNHFVPPLPWHAVLDTSRTLINRAVGADFPGTMGIRRSLFLSMGGYDGDVLFENLELIRRVSGHGGRIAAPLDLYVPRLAPRTGRFFSQRVRQAYDDLALPARMAAWLAVVPVIGALTMARRHAMLAALSVGVIGLAEGGRRKCGGSTIFPARSSLFAPLWVLERGICSWLALGERLRGGVRYGGIVIKKAANPRSGGDLRFLRPP